MALYGGGECLLLTIRLALIATAIFGPAASTWYKFMENNFVFHSPKLTLASRVAGDQLVFTPTHMFCFLTSMSIMEGKDPMERLRTAYLKAYKANLLVWPFVQGVNFAIVPLEHRVLVVNVVSLGMSSLIRLFGC